MANTYTQLLIQLVFAVKNREYLIHDPIRERIEKYMTGIAQNNGHKMLAIYCMPDHCHILLGLNPKQSISDLARDLKANSSKWINEKKWIQGRFSWQEGYGAFSYGKSQFETVVRYILNQPNHHQKKSFQQEYLYFLEKFNVPYNKKYLFDWLS